MNKNQTVEEIKPELVWLDLNKEEMQAYLKDKYTTSGWHVMVRKNSDDVDPTYWVPINSRYEFENKPITDLLFVQPEQQEDKEILWHYVPKFIRVAKIDDLEYLMVISKLKYYDTFDHYINIHRLLPVSETTYYKTIHENVLRKTVEEAFKKCLTVKYQEKDPFRQVVRKLNEVKEGFMTNLSFGGLGYYDDYHPVLKLLQKLLETEEARTRVRLNTIGDIKTWLDALPIPDELKNDWKQYRSDIETMIIARMDLYQRYPYDKTIRTCISRRYKYQTQHDKPYPIQMIALLKYRLRRMQAYSTTTCFQFKRSELMDEWNMGRDHWILSISVVMDVPEALKITFEQAIDEIVKETIDLPIHEVTNVLDVAPDELPF